MDIFCERIKELRIEKGLSQKALANALGTTNSTVCDWERGRSEPDLLTLKKIALFFSVSADYLIGVSDI
ncbi:MAG: helix-turn-helix transcriptional regulator [Clostridia bacterium]|nr:helix-turn-helix transcriptional regulator [Clostridia bacterium]